MQIKTSELNGTALDWAVAKLENPQWWEDGYMDGDPRAALDMDDGTTYSPSTDWPQGGPIIEREGIALYRANSGDWVAQGVYDCASDCERPKYHGPTLLIAAMRCYVASKLGDEVEVPDELVQR